MSYYHIMSYSHVILYLIRACNRFHPCCATMFLCFLSGADQWFIVRVRACAYLNYIKCVLLQILYYTVLMYKVLNNHTALNLRTSFIQTINAQNDYQLPNRKID